MGTASNVTAAKAAVAGAVYVGAISATLPTTTSATLTGFTSLGFVSEDGVTNSSSPSANEVKEWGGSVVLSPFSGREDKWSFKLIEAKNENVLKVVWGDGNVTASTSTLEMSVAAKSEALPDKAWVVDMILRGGKAKRIVIPCGTVTEIGEIAYGADDAVGYEITITAQPNANGITHYEYFAN